MEAHQEKPDDPSDHYGGLREIVMNQQITECIDNLLAAVQSSQEYYEFIKIKEILELDPELLSRVNAFRNSNFKLQNEANREDSVPGHRAAEQRITGASQDSTGKCLS